MRNLKKVLSLVLCMAMMLSIMVVGAGAAFKDQSKIVNEEAVDMCSALNIINGYTDGSFRPEGTITRAEACKMICVALNGGKEPVLGTNATATFTDIKGHWAEKYIEYCVSEGIVAGVGGGKFDPNGNVTGSQFAKMLLIALGYRADHEKFLGSAWEVNVNVKASAKNLYEDLATMDPSVALTRDNAAQMVWNALQAKEVKYEYTLVSENGQLVSKVTVADKGITLMADKYGAVVAQADLTKIVYNPDKAEYKYNDTYVTVDDYTDLLGQNVCIVYKPTYATKNGETTISGVDKVYGIYASEDNGVVVSGTWGDVTEKATAIKIDGVEYDIDNATKYVNIPNANEVDLTTADEVASTENIALYSEFVAIDNDDDDCIDYVIVNPVVYGKVLYVGSDYVKVENQGNLKTDDNEYTTYEGIAKDDYAMAKADTTLKTWGTISEMEKQSGVLSSFSNDGKTAVLGGTTYDLASTVRFGTNDLDETIDFYVINGYVVKADVNNNVDLSEFLVVTGLSESKGANGCYQAEVMFTDGKTDTISISKLNGSADFQKAIADYLKDNTGYLAKFDVDNNKYELTSCDRLNKEDLGFDQMGFNCTWTASESASDANATITVEEVEAQFASDAIVFVDDGEDIALKTGADMAKVTSGAEKNTVLFAGAEENDNGYSYITFAYIKTDSVSTDDAVYGVVVSEGYAVNGTKDDPYYTFQLWNGKETVTLNTKDDDVNVSAVAEGAVVEYELNGDGKVTSVKAVGYAAAVTAYDGGKNIQLNGDNKKIDSDTVILYVDVTNTVGKTGGAIEKAMTTNNTSASGVFGGEYIMNVWAVDGKSAGDALKLIVVDIDNNWYDVEELTADEVEVAD